MVYAEVFPPGEFLKDELEARNWSQAEFAEIIGRPARLINEIIAGKKSITPETAMQFAASLGTSAELWMNLESQYQLSKVQKNQDNIERKAKLHANFPIREMTKRSWLDKSDDVAIMEHQVLKYFGLNTVDEEPQMAHAAKKTCYKSKVSKVQWAWLFRVQQIAQSLVLTRYRKDSLVEALPCLKSLMVAPEEARKVPKCLNDVGVRFVLVEPLPGSKIDGACFWLSDEKPVIAMSSRLDRIDNFWFVLRHEIEHVLRGHGKEGPMIDEDIGADVDSSTSEEETVANDAAREFGVSDADLKDYMMRVNPYFFDEQRVIGLAARLGVHPGIVVGRLQKEMEKSGHPAAYKLLRSYLVKVRQSVAPSAASDGWGTVYPVS